MKTNKSSSKRFVVLSIIAVIATALGIFLYFYYPYLTNPVKGYEPMYPVSTTTQTVVNPQKTQSTDTPTKADPNAGSNTTSQDVPVAASGSIQITELEQTNGYVNARAEVANFTTAKCVYQFIASDSRPVIKEQTGSCGGLSVSQNEFDKIGTYTLTVIAYSATDKIQTQKDIYIK